MKFLIAEKTFKEILNYDSRNNGKSTNTDLFWKRMVILVRNIFLQNYIYWVWENYT